MLVFLVVFLVLGGATIFRHSCFQLHLLHLCCCYSVFKLCFVLMEIKDINMNKKTTV